MASASVDGVAGMMRELIPEDGFDDQRVAPQIRVEGDAIGGLSVPATAEGSHGLIAVENDGPRYGVVTRPAIKEGLLN
mgnify:CR=1 FL=1